MDKYSFRENGVTFSTGGTNYSVRKQIENFRSISSASDLRKGDVVFKKRAPGDAYYDLPPRYQNGGADYNGDLNDYYHIGTVYSVNPLKIIHMTDPSAKVDDKIGKWSCAGNWKSQFISDSPEPEPGPSPEPGPEPEPGPQPTPTPEPDPKVMYVYAENGKPVNMRKRANLNAALVDKVPVGTQIEWLKDNGSGWAYIRFGKKYGWMMEKFMVEEPTPAPEPTPTPTPEPTPTPTPTPSYATVTAPSGRTVKMRQKPSTGCSLYDDVPIGAVVEVVKKGDTWTKINYGRRKGWHMMTKFLDMH